MKGSHLAILAKNEKGAPGRNLGKPDSVGQKGGDLLGRWAPSLMKSATG